MYQRYTLEKYRGMASRYECPACHRKGVFVRYIDTETGRYLSTDVGRCNREDHCGYHYTPKQYFKDHPEQSPRCRHQRGRSNYSERSNRVTPREKAVLADTTHKEGIYTIPKKYLIHSMGYHSNFVRFLLSLFEPDVMDSPTLSRLMSEYYLGCTGNGSVIYWQIDSQNRIRTGKIMQYDPDTGKRLKNESGAVDWVHAKLKHSGVLSEGWFLSQCLFGEHLLRTRPNDTVCLVEGEKSAVIGSGLMPEYIWLATGGKGNLKAELCACLRGRRVILFPDLGAFDVWKAKGEAIASQVGFTLCMFDTLERIASTEEIAAGWDVADYFIAQIQAKLSAEAQQPERLIQQEKHFERKPQIPSLTQTKEECILSWMVHKNSAVYKLVSLLDLVIHS